MTTSGGDGASNSARIEPNAAAKHPRADQVAVSSPLTVLYGAADELLLSLDASYHGHPDVSECPICQATDKFRKVFYNVQQQVEDESPVKESGPVEACVCAGCGWFGGTDCALCPRCGSGDVGIRSGHYRYRRYRERRPGALVFHDSVEFIAEVTNG